MKEKNKFFLKKNIRYFTYFIFLICIISTYINFLYIRSRNTANIKNLMLSIYEEEQIFKQAIGKGFFTTDPRFLCIIQRGSSPDQPSIFDKNTLQVEIQQIRKQLGAPYSGYVVYFLNSSPTQKSENFKVLAVPMINYGLFRTGDDCFYIDQTGIIRHSGSPTKIPDANSPSVE